MSWVKRIKCFFYGHDEVVQLTEGMDEAENRATAIILGLPTTMVSCYRWGRLLMYGDRKL